MACIIKYTDSVNDMFIKLKGKCRLILHFERKPRFSLFQCQSFVACKQELYTGTLQAENIAVGSVLLHHVFIASCGCY